LIGLPFSSSCYSHSAADPLGALAVDGKVGKSLLLQVKRHRRPLAVNTRKYFLTETGLTERHAAIVRIGTPRRFAKTTAAFFR
jgi:hypothetical protein